MWGGKSLEELFHELMERHRGKLLGILGGLVIGLLIIVFGFWKTIFIVLCILIGYFLGRRFDNEGGFSDWWERFFRTR